MLRFTFVGKCFFLFVSLIILGCDNIIDGQFSQPSSNSSILESVSSKGVFVGDGGPVVINLFNPSSLAFSAKSGFQFASSDEEVDSIQLTCLFDQSDDNQVSSGQNCNVLSGLTIDSNGGTFSWTPDCGAVRSSRAWQVVF